MRTWVWDERLMNVCFAGWCCESDYESVEVWDEEAEGVGGVGWWRAVYYTSTIWGQGAVDAYSGVWK